MLFRSKRANLDLNPMPGEALQQEMAKAFDVSPELVERAKKLSELAEQ